MNSIAVVNVGAFIGRRDKPATADKNGNMPVFLRAIAGSKLPEDSLVISGTVAKNLGLRPGMTATISVQFTGKQKDDKNVERNRYAYNIIDLKAGEAVTDKLLEGFSFGAATAPAPATTVAASATTPVEGGK